MVTKQPPPQPGEIPALVSQRIALIRFPLICGVVLIHALYNMDSLPVGAAPHAPWTDWLIHWLGDACARVSVPLFMSISGYLFFHHFDGGLRSHGRKLGGRFRTLILPFLLWNLAVMTVFLVGLSYPATASHFAGHGEAVTQMNPGSLGAWVLGLNGDPPAYQFWFIRNLIVVGMAAPLIHFALRLVGLPLCLALTALWVADCEPFPTWHLLYTLVFFAWGALFQMRDTDLTAADRFLVPQLLLFGLVSGFAVLARDPVHPAAAYDPRLLAVVLLLGCGAIWALFGWLQQRAPSWARRTTQLAPYAFFVFATHEPTCRIATRMANRLLAGDSPLRPYLFGPGLALATILATTAAAAVLQHFAPPLYNLLTGQQRRTGTPRVSRDPAAVTAVPRKDLDTPHRVS